LGSRRSSFDDLRDIFFLKTESQPVDAVLLLGDKSYHRGINPVLGTDDRQSSIWFIRTSSCS